jgi:hypothetical protein
MNHHTAYVAATHRTEMKQVRTFEGMREGVLEVELQIIHEAGVLVPCELVHRILPNSDA